MAASADRRVPRVLFAIVAPLQAFFRRQASSGALLGLAALAALVWVNSPLGDLHDTLFHTDIGLRIGRLGGEVPTHVFVNDVLMSAFFLLAGLEIKRELSIGELRSFRRAALPLVAAAGGMVVPAAIHHALNRGGPAQAGWGIPMATDIAFALGALSVVRSRVPTSLFVFLTALAIFDDLGAILVIAFFYGGGVHVPSLVSAGVVTLALFALGALRVQRRLPYVALGVVLWIFVHHSGLHATLAGVVLGLAVPARARKAPSAVMDDLDEAIDAIRRTGDGERPDGGTVAAIERHLESVQAPLDRLLHALETPVAWVIVPLFALANAGVVLGSDALSEAREAGALGVFLGLLVGKPVGVFGATWLAVKVGLAPRPTGSTWTQVLGISVLAGIGFTMSLFVANLAFDGQARELDEAKIGILSASIVCGLAGVALLRTTGVPASRTATDDKTVRVDLRRFAHGFLLETWTARGPLVGQTLEEAQIRRRLGVNVLGVFRPGSQADDDEARRALAPASADYRVRAGDVLLVVGEAAEVRAFLALGTTEPPPPPPPPSDPPAGASGEVAPTSSA